MARQKTPQDEPPQTDPRERSQPTRPGSRKGDDTPTRPIRIDRQDQERNVPRDPTAEDPGGQLDLDRTAPREAL
jgi:hypothetical protein